MVRHSQYCDNSMSFQTLTQINLYILLLLQFNRELYTEALYVNGRLLQSLKYTSPMVLLGEGWNVYFKLFGESGYTGVWFNFLIHREPLTDR